MTSFVPNYERCALCGERTTQVALGCLQIDDHALDGRHVTCDGYNILPAYVQACAHCGYRASQLRFAPAGAAGWIREPAYQQLAARDDVPALARDFMCAEYIAARANRFVFAGWHALRAAWALDDAGLADDARRWRIVALARFDLARRAGKRLFTARSLLRWVWPGSASRWIFLADIARRAGKPRRARALLERAEARNRGGDTSNRISGMIRFERHLLETGDVNGHTGRDAQRWCASEAFKAAPRVRTLGGGTLVPATAPAEGARISGVRAMFVHVEHLSLEGNWALHRRYGRWSAWIDRGYRKTEYSGNPQLPAAERAIQVAEWEEHHRRRSERTFADIIDEMFEGSGTDWEEFYGENPPYGGGWRESQFVPLLDALEQGREYVPPSPDEEWRRLREAARPLSPRDQRRQDVFAARMREMKARLAASGTLDRGAHAHA